MPSRFASRRATRRATRAARSLSLSTSQGALSDVAQGAPQVQQEELLQRVLQHPRAHAAHPPDRLHQTQVAARRGHEQRGHQRARAALAPVAMHQNALPALGKEKWLAEVTSDSVWAQRPMSCPMLKF